MIFRELLKKGIETLDQAGISDASNDARILMEYCFGINREKLLLSYEEEVTAEDAEKNFGELIERRAARIPLQHIIGTADFMGLEFKVDENVLVPRFDTEILVEEALKSINDGDRILDMCTGSGCILVSLLKFSNNCHGVGVDLSPKALEIARRNAEVILHDREDVSIEFVQSDMFDNLSLTQENFDMIVSNPPYIETEEIEKLEPEVRLHDPMMALDGGTDGLDFYRVIAQRGHDFLRPGGVLLLEIGCEQGESVEKMLLEADFQNIEIFKDYSGLDRVVRAERKINYV